MKLYLLELIISTADRIVCEPLGIYDSNKLAKENLKKLEKVRPSSDSFEYNIVSFTLNNSPSILKAKDMAMEFFGDELLNMYQSGMIDQMIEPDGSFSYVITGQFKTALEKAMARFQQETEDE